MNEGFICNCCGNFHNTLPLSYACDAPIYWFGIPEKERKKRCKLTSDLCVIDDKDYFIRGCLEIPIIGSQEKFDWNVWVSLSKANFDLTTRCWKSKDRDNLEPMFGWLSTRLPYNPDTINLKALVHTRKVGTRPFIELEPTDHPLAIEQRDGITIRRVQEIAEGLLHSN
jgi:hypothetical protein